MSYKRNNSYAILITASLIALALITTTSFNHSYTVFAVSKKTDTSSKSSSGGSSSGGGVTTLGGGSSSSATAPNSNTLTKKELSSFTSCINTANKSEGLTHKVVTNCLDTARGIISSAASSSSTTTGSSRSSPSLAPSVSSSS
jgi:hypothetical protein